jgi:iron complex transport system substrate-binding protein
MDKPVLYWIPQMVEIAGGINGLSSRGQPSPRNSDKIILMPCCFDIHRTLEEAKTLRTNKKMENIAVADLWWKYNS